MFECGEYQALELIVILIVATIAIIAIFTPIILITLAFTRRSSKRRTSKEEEIKLIQDLHHGLENMERRVEALETILFDKGRRSP